MALLLALARAMDRATGGALDSGATELTLTQLRALRILRARSRSITDLSAALGRRRSSTSRQRREALQRELLYRLPEDRRETEVSCLRQLVVAMDDGGPLDEEVWSGPHR